MSGAFQDLRGSGDRAVGEAVPPRYATAVARSFAWQGGASFLAQAVSWLSTIVVIRLLSPSDYGLMAMATLFVGFLMLVSDLGVGAAAIQARSLDHRQLRELSGLALLSNVLVGATAFLAAPMVAQFFGETRLVPVVRMLSVVFVGAAFYVIPQSLVIRELRFDQKAKADVLAATLGALCSLWLALSGFGIWSLVGGVLTLHGVKAVTFQALRPCLFMPAFSFRATKGSLRFGRLITLNRILWFSYGNLDIAIAGRMLGKNIVGLYSVALSLASVPLEKIMPAITQVSFAAFSLIQEDRERVRRNVLRAIEAVSLIAFPTFVGMAAVAPEFVPLVLGQKWIEIVLPFQILCLVLPLKSLGSLFPPALFAIDRPQVNVVNMALSLAGMGVAFVVGVQYGLIGLCLAWLAGYPIIFCVTAYRALGALGVSVRKAALGVRFPLVATLVMAFALAASRLTLGPVLTAPALLGTLIVVGVSSYAIMVVAFNRHVLRSFWALTRAN